CIPQPEAVAETRALAPAQAARVAQVRWAAPLPSLTLTGEPHGLSHPFAWDGTRVQHSFSVAEKTPTVLCLATAGPTEPQDVCGAATPGWHLPTEMKSAHATDCRRRQALESGKTAKTPLRGIVCLLTKGVLIRVRPSLGAAPGCEPASTPP